MKKYKIILSTIAAGILLAGCSVKPEPILSEYVKEDVKNNLLFLNQISQPITKPITLDEAINRAIENNLSKKLDLLSSALAEQKIDIVAFEALPSLTTKAGYSNRNNRALSASGDQYGNILEDPTYTTSQDKESKTAGVAFSWNILDFGLSYVRANQQADRFLIAKEKERKSIHNIKEEVRNTYYQAVSADELLQSIQPIMKEVQKALDDSEKMTKLNLDSPIKSLTYQRELLEVIRSLNTLEENLLKSKTELSKLMGLKPRTHFELAEKIKDKYELPNVEIPVETLEKYALENRPELQETRYQERISQDEVRAVMLKMLPGIDLNAGYSSDNSKYLLNNDWISYGTGVSWNLMNVFNSNLNHKLAETQIELAKQQKLALSMAVISQVHISMLDFEQAKKDYKLSEKYFGVAKEIYKIIENENALDVNGNLSLIKEKLNYLISNLRLSSSYAKVQNSYGKVISSVGNEEFFNKPVETTQSPVLVVEEKKVEPKLEPEVVIEKVIEVEKEKIQEQATSSSFEKTAYTTADLNLREKPTLNSKVLGKVLKGEKVTLLKEDIENPMWYKTENGYLWAEYLEIQNSN